MLMVNRGNAHLLWRGQSIAPAETVEIEDGYCWPGIGANGSRVQSVVERRCPGLVPVDEALRQRVSGLPRPADPTQATQADIEADLIDRGMPPGVAALIASGNAEKPKRPPGRPRKAVV